MNDYKIKTVDGYVEVNSEEFTDRVDVNFETSLGEYGVARNPQDGKTWLGAVPDDGYYEAFDFMYITLDEVKDALDNIDQGFFDWVDGEPTDYINSLDNDNLANVIKDINMYNGYFAVGSFMERPDLVEGEPIVAIENETATNEEYYDQYGNELNQKEFEDAINKGLFESKEKTMYDEYGNPITPEEYAKGVADGTVNEAKEVDEHEVNELVLYMENTQKHYNSIMAVVKNLAKKMAKGNFDKELAVKGMMYPVNDGARAYKKEFSGEGYEKYDFNPATRKAAAEELLDRYMEDIEREAGAKNEMFDEYGKEVTPEEYAKGVADGTINENKETYKGWTIYKGKEPVFVKKDDNGYTVWSLGQISEEPKTIIDNIDDYTNEGSSDLVQTEDELKNTLKEYGVNESKINEAVEDETDDKALALEDYLVEEEGEDPSEVAESIKKLDYDYYGMDQYEVAGMEFAITDDYDVVEEAAKEEVIQLIDELGADALNWNNLGGIENYLASNWFDEAMEESNQFYIDDIRNETASSDEFESRLEEEMAKAGVETEEDYLEVLNNNYDNGYEWYVDNFGTPDGDVVAQAGLDAEKAAEECLRTDGPGHLLSRHDGEMVEWKMGDKTYYIFRNN